MDVVRPLIIVGTGRCGSTALHRLLAYHPELCWFSHYCARTPTRPAVNRAAMRLLDSPLPHELVRRYVRPSESYAFWNHYFQGFGTPGRDLTADDLPVQARARLRASIAAMLTPQRPRLLLKITGWPRLGFLMALFPDAQFVHVRRDGRAVASSLVQKPWWAGWRGPSGWAWGELSQSQQQRWDATGRCFVALAGLQWELLMDAFERARAPLGPADYLEVGYEEICRDKHATLRRITDFAGLPWPARFARTVDAYPFVNTDHKWREQLNPAQQRNLQQVLQSALARHGYDGATEEAPPAAASSPLPLGLARAV